MVFAHMDQLGFIVRRVEADGYIQVDRLGGIPEKVLPGLKLLLRSEDGLWHPGVFGPKAHHASSPEEKTHVDAVTSLFIDMGASSKEQVNELGIYPGCPVIYQPSFEELLGGRVSGTAIDDRGGCACLVRIAEILRENPAPCDVYLVGTVWEEFNLRGAMMAARTVKPDIALCMDVTLTGDTHDLMNKYETRLGDGPCVQLYSFHGRGTLNGTLPHEPLFKLAKRAAQEESIPFQRIASLGLLTDAAYLQLEEGGVAILEMGYPTRYTHSPVETCDPKDTEKLSHLIGGMLCRIDESFPLKRY
jgi:putative aminopeptidase FrvX